MTEILKQKAGFKAKRYDWIDIAKAIAIIAMITGHMCTYGSGLRNFIYSFHMPVFFVLTGYTLHRVETVQELGRRVWKDFRKIYVPCLIFAGIHCVLDILLNGGAPAETVKTWIFRLFWAKAYDLEDPYLGSLWFLIALFWAKLIFYVVNLILKRAETGIVFCLLAFVGKMISASHPLPQALDVAMVAALFLYFGYFLRNHSDVIEKYHIVITAASFFVWMLCLQNGLYVEIGTRYYPMFILSVTEACCGVICILYFSKAVEKNHVLTKILTMIGRHTLLILGVNSLDSFLLRNLPATGFAAGTGIRIIADLAIAAVILLIQKAICSGAQRKGNGADEN